ncbi:Glutamate receptor family protein [Prunus dulcis]|uniref:Glutamate receptor family protein n=1 Tax=Prunus dulcis TaxID=3755 RepID=A0A4Y1RRC0_PRUDU|nr:Glutamate receptor family protein [Prunus dulcis]
MHVSLAALDVPACETLSICGVGCSGVWKDFIEFRVITMALDVPYLYTGETLPNFGRKSRVLN